jgi:hypothetical protein
MNNLKPVHMHVCKYCEYVTSVHIRDEIGKRIVQDWYVCTKSKTVYQKHGDAPGDGCHMVSVADIEADDLYAYAKYPNKQQANCIGSLVAIGVYHLWLQRKAKSN